MICIKEANDIHPEVLLKPHDVTFGTVKNLGIRRVNDNLKICEAMPPLRYLD